MQPKNYSSYLSKSLFIRGLQCHKSLYLDRHHPELREEPSELKKALWQRGTEVGLFAQQLFPGGENVPYEGLSFGEQLQLTKAAITKGASTLYEGAFSFDNIFIKVDILNRASDGWEVYEVKGTTSVKDYHLDDVALQYYVLSGAGLPIKKAYLVHVNNRYVREGAIEVQKLFALQDLTDIVKEKRAFVSKQIPAMREMLKKGTIPAMDIGDYCHDPYDCDFLGHCWKHIPEYSVFDLSGKGVKGLDLYRQGIMHLKDVPLDILSNGQRMQAEAFLEKREFVNPRGIKAFLDSLWYPLCFLDFETFQAAIPRFDCTRPYQQIPFQYSLHLLEGKDARLKHYEFLAQPGRDPRQELLEKLISEIPENACLLVYNQSFETLILQSLGEWFPEYKGRIEAIIGNMRGLEVPFRRKDFYHWKMRGSYSLKYVLPAMVPDLSYEGMEISEGDLASGAYFKMNEVKDQLELQKLRSALLEYCRLDSLAMVRILEKLKEI